MDYNDLHSYVGAGPDDGTFVQQCWLEAAALVGDFVGAAVLPVSVFERAVLETGSELFHRRNAPNGIAQFAAFDGSVMRVARDPMVPAYPLLRRYMVVL